MIDFKPRDDCNYKYDYKQIFADIAKGDLPRIDTYRMLVKNDLWFIVYFCMEIPPANSPFVVDMCKIVEEGPQTKTLDIWSREHFKSTIITQAETIQAILRNPECTTAIFSFKKPAADKFLDGIRRTFEKPMMKEWFPDVLWDKPESQAPTWSLQNGITVRRKSVSRRGRTVEAFGLVEGMPTGGHFDRRVYDDVETADLAKSPEQLEMCFQQFEYSDYLGVAHGGIERIVGTYYSHSGPLIRIQNKETIHGTPAYLTRVVPGSDDGTATGNPVLVSQERREELQTGEHFNQQILCDPTPATDRSLPSDELVEVERHEVPGDVMKFLLVDPAGDQATQKGSDSWAYAVVGVDPHIDDIGASDIYILDMEIMPHKHSEAIEAISRMYMRNGVIQALAVEKVGQSTAEVHISNALRAHNRSVSIESNTLRILKPAGRNKEDRILSALQWPLNNGKIHYVDDIKEEHVMRLKNEMDKFPVWHDDGIDMLSYLYDILIDYRFSRPQKLEPLPYPKIGVV
jgi:hypothetical protein